jgi:ABC-2 type transport system permease protein
VHRLLAVARVYSSAMLTYRTQTVFSLVSALISIIPVYYIAQAVQQIAAPAIRKESPEYFTYLVLGFVGLYFVAEAVNALPSLVNSYISNGSLEQLLGTPLRWPALLTGLSLYGYGWVLMRALVLMIVAWTWATSTIIWTRLPEFVVIIALLAATYSGVGLIAAACVLRFRSSLYVPQLALMFATLFGTVWFPVAVLPAMFRPLAELMPMTHGMRAARQVLILDQPLTAVLPDVWVVCLWTAGSLAVGAFVFDRALRAARRDGTLSQY